MGAWLPSDHEYEEAVEADRAQAEEAEAVYGEAIVVACMEAEALASAEVLASTAERLADPLPETHAAMTAEERLDEARANLALGASVPDAEGLAETSGEIPASSATVVLEQWQGAYVQGIAVLEDRMAALRNVPLGLERQLTLLQPLSSVSAISRQAVFVSWSDPDLRQGREALLDRDGRVIYSVPLRRNLHWPEEESAVVHPAVGAVMYKRKGAHRDRIPESMRLKRMWDICTGSTLSSFSTCRVCGLADSADLGEDAVRQCGLCLQTFHWACCRRHVSVLEGLCDLPMLPAGILPADGHSAMCPWCAAAATRGSPATRASPAASRTIAASRGSGSGG